MAAVGDNNIMRYTYTGTRAERIPDGATHIFVTARVVRSFAFFEHQNIVDVICHEDVETIQERAFSRCPSLRRVIMPGVMSFAMRTLKRFKRGPSLVALP